MYAKRPRSTQRIRERRSVRILIFIYGQQSWVYFLPFLPPEDLGLSPCRLHFAWDIYLAKSYKATAIFAPNVCSHSPNAALSLGAHLQNKFEKNIKSQQRPFLISIVRCLRGIYKRR
jgi:hypothetical protein